MVDRDVFDRRLARPEQLLRALAGSATRDATTTNAWVPTPSVSPKSNGLASIPTGASTTLLIRGVVCLSAG